MFPADSDKIHFFSLQRIKKQILLTPNKAHFCPKKPKVRPREIWCLTAVWRGCKGLFQNLAKLHCFANICLLNHA